MDAIKSSYGWLKARTAPFSIGILAGIGVQKFDLLTLVLGWI